MNIRNSMVIGVVSLLLSAGIGSAAEMKSPAAAAGDAVKADVKVSGAAAKVTVKGKAADAKTAAKGKIDINTASADELKAVPGIGDAFAAKIVAGRPYANKAQLKSRNILPANVYEQVKEMLIAKVLKK